MVYGTVQLVAGWKAEEEAGSMVQGAHSVAILEVAPLAFCRW